MPAKWDATRDTPAVERLSRSRRPKASRALAVFLLTAIIALAGCSTPWTTSAPTPTATRPPLPTPTASPTSYTCQNAYAAPNPIATENTCPGTASWKRSLPVGASGAIDGYIAPASITAGDPAQLFVTTTASTYTYAVYRMGYYQGLGGRLIYQSPSISGEQQPAATIDPQTRMVVCPWRDPVIVVTQASWVSGMYLIKLVSSDGFERYTFLVVRDPHPHAPILYSLPFTTYEAYNTWGGYSLYYHIMPDGSISHDLRSYAVSFDRPYLMGPGLYYFGQYDLPMLSWMESQSYNISYVADFDLDAPTMDLRAFKLIISSGHAEYWSAGMRASVTGARDAGVSLAFFGGNQMYWRVRFQSSPLGLDRVVVCYRSVTLDPLAAADPQAATVRWRDPPLNQPEDQLLGEEYAGILQSNTSLVLDSGAAPYLTGSGLTPGATQPGLIVGEYDKVVPGEEPANLQIIATSPVLQQAAGVPAGVPDVSNATLYTAPSGAKVFDAGSFGWPLGLSGLAQGYSAESHTGFRQFTANILTALLSTDGGSGGLPSGQGSALLPANPPPGL